MSPSLIAQLTATDQRQLLDDLNYLNLAEIRAFCKKHSIPHMIFLERPDGSRKSTGEPDRKGVVLHRIRHYLHTGTILAATCFPATVAASSRFPKQPSREDRLFYRHYHRSNTPLMATLKKLTRGKYRDGAVARILLREFWSRGEPPTLGEYASAWLRASGEYMRPHPEWAFLSDVANRTASANWKELRNFRAKSALKILNSIAPIVLA